MQSRAERLANEENLRRMLANAREAEEKRMECRYGAGAYEEKMRERETLHSVTPGYGAGPGKQAYAGRPTQTLRDEIRASGARLKHESAQQSRGGRVVGMR